MRSIEYANHLLPYAAISNPRDLTSISNFLQRRQIKWMFHFTHFLNLESIYQRGILSRELMQGEEISFEPTDMDRLDGLLGGISISLSFPNYWMLKRKVESRGNNFAIIEISANALLNKRIVAFPSNASRYEFESMVPKHPEDFVGARGLSNLYLNKEVRLKNNLGSSIPTDVQSEIMVFDSIDTHSLRGVHLPSDSPPLMLEAVQRLNLQYPDLGVDYPCKHSYFDFGGPKSFKPHDGRRWQPDWK